MPIVVVKPYNRPAGSPPLEWPKKKRTGNRPLRKRKPKPKVAKKPKPEKPPKMTRKQFVRMLNKNGWTCYTHYRRSSVWKRIRAAVLERDEYTCTFCGRDAKQVHHAEYSEAVMLGHNLNPLFSLCPRCHLRLEFTPTGAKVPHNRVRKQTWRENKWSKSISRQHYLLDAEFDAIVSQ